MRMPWHKSKGVQLELTGLEPEPNAFPSAADVQPGPCNPSSASVEIAPPVSAVGDHPGRAMHVAIHLLREDLNNPRTEFPDADLDELTVDIRERGILQPIVVHPADGEGHYLVQFGAKRLRAAQRAGLMEVPIVVRDAPADPYSQVAENQKRHGLSPIDLARFIKSRVEAGDSNATIAKRLGMNLTTVAHHLALLDLPPELDQALKSGRCTSPRTLHELSKLHDEQPERAKALVAGEAEITRTTVTALRAAPTAAPSATSSSSSFATLLVQANATCARLERTLALLKKAEHEVGEGDLAALRQRVADLASRLA
jgi:ParB family chromosome partitioning protein